MWHVIVMILKIIGILLLVILGIILFLVLTGLVVPVRYQVKAEKQESIQANAKLTWLLHVVSIPIQYENGILSVRLKLFGITIKKILTEEEKAEEEIEKLETEAVKKTAETAERAEEQKIQQTPKTETKDSPKTAALEQKQPLLTEKTGEEAGKAEETGKAEEAEKTAETGKTEETGKMEEAEEKAEKSKEKTSKFIALLQKFSPWRILSRILEKLKKLKYTIRGFCAKIKAIWKRGNDLKEFLQLDSTKNAFLLCKDQVFYLFRKLLPKKIQGWIHFGTDDPALTGQILGGISMFYGLLPQKLELHPDFQQNVLEGEIFMKGNLRLFTVVKIAWRLWRDKNVRAVYKRVKRGF